MYCPQCGRELDLGSGDVSFCRYCGFSLIDTREELQGFAKQKRAGFSVVTWAYALLLIVTLLLHGKYVSVDTGWGYWATALLIVLSVSFFVSASFSAMKPAMFARTKRDRNAELGPRTENTGAIPAGQPLREINSRERITANLRQPPSVTKNTTKKFENQ